MNTSEPFPFEKTILYQKAYTFVKECRVICQQLPSGYSADRDQLKRASLSILNNFSEGYGRWHKNDKKHFYVIARGSAYETVPMLSLLYDENQIQQSELERLRIDVAEITRMLSGMIQKLDERA